MKKSNLILLGALVTLGLTGCNNGVNEGTKVNEYEETVVKVEHEVVVKGEAGAEEVTVTLAATSDVHGRIYPYEYAIDSEDKDAGFAKTHTIVKELREENPNLILIDVGDTVQDNSAELFNNLETHPMVEAMNEMNYDMWVLGNHEFNFEKEFITRNINNFDGVVVNANIYNEVDGSHFVQPYQIYEVEGVRVAVVGAIPPHVPMWEASAPEHFKGLEFEDPIVSIKKTIDSIEGQYDVLVGAFHLSRKDEYGLTGVMDIANEIEEFDLIFHGHEHAKHVTDVNGTPVLEPGAYGWAVSVGEIKLTKVDGKWTIEEVVADNLQTKEKDADQDLLDKFKFVHDESIADANTVVGEVTGTFIDRVDFITGEDDITTMPTSQLQDNAVIELINEVQMHYADAEISSAAIFNFDSNLKEGDFKKKDVAFIYKYTNTLMGVNMTGENLLNYMEWSANYYKTWNEGDVTVAFNPKVRGYNYDIFDGINYDINLSKESGNRIENVTFNGEAIDPNRVYKVALNNYRFGTLMNKGWAKAEDKYYDSYEQMQDAGRMRDMIVKYVIEEKNGTIKPTVDNNWQLTGINLEYPETEEIYQKIRAGEIVIPTAEGGRSINAKAVNRTEI